MADNKKWIVMVFMGAATIEGEEDLLAAAEDDLEEMASVGSGPIRGGGQLDIYVQVYADMEPRSKLDKEQGKVPRAWCGKITPDMFASLPKRPNRKVGDLLKYFANSGETKEITEMGPKAVEEFVHRAIGVASPEKGNGNPVEPDEAYSMLVLWGHAYDFALGRSVRRDGTIDALDFAELAMVLENFQKKLTAPAKPSRKLDILGFDACGLSTVEIACQLEPFATYLLASEIGIPIPGWPYDRILDRLRNPEGRLMNPVEFGSYVVRRFCESYEAESLSVSLTLLNLKRVTDLRTHTECLALTLDKVIADARARDGIAYLMSESQTEAGKPFVDLGDVCFNLVRRGTDALVVEAARALGDLLIDPPPLMVGKRSGEMPNQSDLPLIIEHGRNSVETARLNGISFYAPHVAPQRDYRSVQPLYLKLQCAKTQWSVLMHTLARLS